ncbi:MAG: hypothetical protein OXG21_05955 [Rhodobacteraceae bacterium]|nr:hypothetical protein [Paracoccaceae bacterium]
MMNNIVAIRQPKAQTALKANLRVRPQYPGGLDFFAFRRTFRSGVLEDPFDWGEFIARHIIRISLDSGT